MTKPGEINPFAQLIIKEAFKYSLIFGGIYFLARKAQPYVDMYANVLKINTQEVLAELNQAGKQARSDLDAAIVTPEEKLIDEIPALNTTFVFILLDRQGKSWEVLQAFNTWRDANPLVKIKFKRGEIRSYIDAEVAWRVEALNKINSGGIEPFIIVDAPTVKHITDIYDAANWSAKYADNVGLLPARHVLPAALRNAIEECERTGGRWVDGGCIR